MRNLVILMPGIRAADYAGNIAGAAGFALLGVSESANAIALDSGEDSPEGAVSAAGEAAALLLYPSGEIVQSWNYGAALPFPSDLAPPTVGAQIVATITQKVGGGGPGKGVPVWAIGGAGVLALVSGVWLLRRGKKRRG